jgi:uncharacterized protein HemX
MIPDFTPELIQSIVSSVVVAAVVTGIFTYLNKRAKSPESQNQLAEIGTKFASQLLVEAQNERKELRTTIADLEKLNDVKQSTIDRLQNLLNEKDRRIHELENRQRTVAFKLQRGEVITLNDIFGEDAPHIQVALEENAA